MKPNIFFFFFKSLWSSFLLSFNVFWGMDSALGASLAAQKFVWGHRPLRGPNGAAGGQAGPSPPPPAP